ncbi:DUF2231 domain-containing protein [Deinococcus maricopensis]|uniref:DUF2231 domain-containing protein n=1 Tax=Deinococcus maricopensis (strain DSM 21211 / LMG 22137 / NRRL B-23946 / LB-34) TaxID=709986 RepID=E8U4N0_DEIML|nr:DUF2231 domain-containing protein [Deinococcus maricopensis]ADV68895.1 hypothetical protein Deima_3268 [Deinococcus maricopensis DSM 21211]
MTHTTTADRIDEFFEAQTWPGALADALQPHVQVVERALPDAVHGRGLGHPLHPAIVHLPLGGWVVAGVLDAAGHDEAADRALLIGTVGAVPTIALGWLDWANTRGTARNIGVVHGLLNETAFTLNVVSLWARARGQRGLGRALSNTALALSGVSGFLGGHLVYHHGLGVGQTLDRPQG